MMKHGFSAWLASLAQQATPTLDECFTYLSVELPWLAEFKQTPQDPAWHAEGNVYIHTAMVLTELYTLLADEAASIHGERRQALILGAVLHDIGKPKQTRRAVIQTLERIIAPQHEAVGRSYLAFKLMAWELPFAVVWTVLNLVGEHHMPKQLVTKDKPAAGFYRLASQVDLELLYCLEVADMRGRICQDLDWQLLCLEEFRALAQGYGVWQQPLAIRDSLVPALQILPASAQHYVYAYAQYQLTQGHITQAEEALATTYANRLHHAHLVVMCGPSGAGKSTWIKQHYADYTVISLDELRDSLNGDRSQQENTGQIRQLAKEQLKAALRQKQKVVWDATNLRADFRNAITSLGHDYHALVTLVLFLLPETTLALNNRKRESYVAEPVLQRQLGSFQFPLLTEAHQYQVIGQAGKLLYTYGFY